MPHDRSGNAMGRHPSAAGQIWSRGGGTVGGGEFMTQGSMSHQGARVKGALKELMRLIP